MKNKELAEARRIIKGLNDQFNSLPADDRRFVRSWAEYLDNAGDGAVIGRARLAQLSLVGARYGLVEQATANGLVDAVHASDNPTYGG